jgi:hypothetical protein
MRNVASLIDTNHRKNELKLEIKSELLKLTYLIRKKCCICSKIQENILFSYENKNIFYFVCSNCIIKLALNDLIEQGLKKNKKYTNVLLKRELKLIIDYIESETSKIC